MIFASVDGRLAVDTRRCILLDGCFDPIHHGHVRYVREAKRAFPDWPIVIGVASDDEIRQKGREPLLSQFARCAAVDGLQGVDTVIAKDRPTHEIISALKPVAFLKGKDWNGNLPAEILAACSLNDVQVVYLGDMVDSSTKRLRQWALKDAEASLDRLEAFMAQQEPPSTPWQPVTDYSFEARKEIEGPHAKLIKEAFQPSDVLDVGCGPGHLVQMLNDVGVEHVWGMDVSWEDAKKLWYLYGDISNPGTVAFEHDLVICREVLEHLPVRDISVAVANLFRFSTRFVYITTRFSSASVFDAGTEFDVDPTHITCLTQPFLRSLCVLNGGKRRRDLEQKLDHQNKGRVLVYEV